MNAPKFSVLIATHDREEALLLKSVCKSLGCRVKVVVCFDDAVQKLRKREFHILIARLYHPSVYGIELVSRLREKNERIPVIGLVDSCSVTQLSDAYENGTNIVHITPIIDVLLESQIKSLMISHNLKKVLKYRNMRMKFGTNEIQISKKRMQLSRNEAKLMQALLENPSEVFSRELIIKLLNLKETTENGAVDTLISRLRKKLGRDIIKTEFGYGYRLDAG